MRVISQSKDIVSTYFKELCPQAGFDPPVHSDTSYEADALHPSHHGWIASEK